MTHKCPLAVGARDKINTKTKDRWRIKAIAQPTIYIVCKGSSNIYIYIYISYAKETVLPDNLYIRLSL